MIPWTKLWFAICHCGLTESDTLSLQAIFTSNLSDKKYNSDNCKNLTTQLTELIRTQVKQELGVQNRYVFNRVTMETVLFLFCVELDGILYWHISLMLNTLTPQTINFVSNVKHNDIFSTPAGLRSLFLWWSALWRGKEYDARPGVCGTLNSTGSLPTRSTMSIYSPWGPCTESTTSDKDATSAPTRLFLNSCVQRIFSRPPVENSIDNR